MEEDEEDEGSRNKNTCELKQQQQKRSSLETHHTHAELVVTMVTVRHLHQSVAGHKVTLTP